MKLLLILLFGILHAFLMYLLGVDTLFEWCIYTVVSLTGITQAYIFGGGELTL